MTKTFDMRFMRYMNLFSRVTRVRANHAFLYNNMIVFVVSHGSIDRAIGKNNENLRRVSEILGKRIRVVSEPRGLRDINGFVSVIISPLKFKGLEVVESNEAGEKEILISTTGRENKAMLIGRERAREKELKDILEQYFGIKNVKIL